MATIISTNPDVVSIFSKMEEIIIKEGGFIHPDIQIVENNGNLIVESSLNKDNTDIIFSVPESCLFDTEDITIVLSDNNLIITACKENISDLHKKICALMLNLFNQTDKVPYHKKTFPLPLLNNPTAFNLVAKKCPGICTKHKIDAQELSREQLIVKTFLGCRQLNMKIANRHNAKVLMPFIDSLNHNLKCTGIDVVHDSDNSSSGLQIKHSKPLPDSDECFINYGPMDPMVRYFHFGYIDTMPYYLQSIPVVLDFSDLGKIIINPFNATASDSTVEFPNELQNIKFLLPNVIKRTQNLLIWRLFIPIDSKHGALRRILEALILNLAGKKIKRKKLEKLIKNAETKIINENKAYCEAISTLTKSTKLAEVPETMRVDFAKLANLQLMLLRKYQQKANKLPLCYL